VGAPRHEIPAGTRFGAWTVVKRDISRKDESFWICLCDCGVEKSVRGHRLEYGKSKSCGCQQGKLLSANWAEKRAKRLEKPKEHRPSKIDKVNYFERFGRLFVEEAFPMVGKGGPSQRYWVCRCDCGMIVAVKAHSLAYGNTKSCGCKRVEGIQRQIAYLQSCLERAEEKQCEKAADQERICRATGVEWFT
jgi:hypothetical protein